MSLRYFWDDLKAVSKSNSPFINAKWFLFNHTLHLTFLFRLGQDLCKLPLIGKIFAFVVEYIIRIIYSSDISCRARIGPGFVIVHGHDIVIGADVAIGRRCKIFNGVTLGNKDTDQSSAGNQPELGDNTLLSTGAKILGPIKIGNNVVIGANSVVIRSVGSNAVVAGIPAKVIKEFR